MLKFIKYEIKGTYKYILGILVLVLILITGLYASLEQIAGGSFGGSLFMGLSMMILFGTALVTFLYIVGSFRKELYEDQGYLTFTLPLTGIQIVGAKLIVALMWFFILGIVIALYNLTMVFSFVPIPAEMNFSNLLAEILNTVSIKAIFFMIVASVFSGVNLLIIIYFSMVLGKVTFRNKRIGGLWFVIFLILSGILSFGQYSIETIFPYYLDLESFKVITQNVIDSEIGFTFGNSGFHGQTPGSFPVNIASTIYAIVTTVALFFGTGYLIEKKIDL